jgi:1-aminocyclopropane-1-carboxylate deaminase
MDIIDESKIEIQALDPAWAGDAGITIDMLRLDLIHPVVSGNKWYKLRHNIEDAVAQGYDTILTFGGVYSNHLSAAAGAAKAFGLSSIGIVRGDEGNITETLRQCRDMGMELYFISREEYKQKNDPEFLQQLSEQTGHPYIIPEGGANEHGRLGAEKIEWEIPEGYTHVCVSVGTGTTFIGLRNALSADVQLLVFAPMKQGSYLSEEIRPFLKDGQDVNWELFDRWHFGGFGKSNEELVGFMNEFYLVNNIPLDVVYTSKMMYGMRELVAEGFFPEGSRVLCVHTGGLQGNGSVNPLTP